MTTPEIIFTEELFKYSLTIPTKVSLTATSLTWQEGKKQHCLSLDDIVGATKGENNHSFVVNAYPLYRGKRRLREEKFICKDAATTVNLLNAINNTLRGLSPDSKTPPPHLQILINPQSGRKKGRQIFAQVHTLLAKSYLHFTVTETTAPGNAKNFSQNLDLTAIDGLIIIGGDGTIYEVINGLMSRADWETAIKTPLGIIPGGTSNGLCKTLLTIAGEDYNPINAAFIIVKGKEKPLDLMMLEQNGKRFYSFLSLSWGFVADADIESDKLRYLGSLKNDIYALILMLKLRIYRGKFSFLPKKEQEWQTIEDDFIVFWAMNLPWAAYNLKAAPHAQITDGAIDILIVRKGISRWQLLTAFLGCSTGKHISLPYVEYYQVCSFNLEPLTSKGILAVDGEQVKYSPVKMQILKTIARVLTVKNPKLISH